MDLRTEDLPNGIKLVMLAGRMDIAGTQQIDVRFTADRPVRVELRSARGMLATTTVRPGEPARLSSQITPVTPWNNCLRLPSGGHLTFQSFEVRAAR